MSRVLWSEGKRIGEWRRIQQASFIILRGVLLGLLATAATAQTTNSDLMQMPLEDLMSIKVTSVSKHEQRLSRAPAAVFVITQEDIRRSGAMNIPDLLRMAPGVDVEQIDANAWAISIRGFNSRYSNKVLVLIDGRSVYTASFSGVFWEHLDMPLSNIERIEVIRGAGATVWGANAVNGVISIVTKSSRATQGTTVSAAGGSHLKSDGLVQYGGTAGTAGAYRIFGEYFSVGESLSGTSDDHWQRSHGGFRTDWSLSPTDSFMAEGDLFANQASQLRRSNLVPTPADTIFTQVLDAAGGDVLARWEHTFSGGSQTLLQGYYDTYRRSDFGVPEVERTADLDFQDHVSAGDRHEIVWGGGYRSYFSALGTGYWLSLNPPGRRFNLYSAFVQDEVRLGSGLWLTLGSRFEHNDYTGFQTEPSARLMWTSPSERTSVWAAASDAKRQPSRADADIQLDLQQVPVGPDSVMDVKLYGNRHIQNEKARDYEAGYRTDLGNRFSVDFAGFLTFYRRLGTDDPQPMTVVPGSPVLFEVPMFTGNAAHAVDYGAELSASWKPATRWRLNAGYSYLHTSIQVLNAQSTAIPDADTTTDFPRTMLQFRSAWDVTRRTEFDQALYYTARLPGGAIPGHTRFDLRLAHRFTERMDISVVGQNLFTPRSFEYGDSYGVVGAATPRSVYGRITWHF